MKTIRLGVIGTCCRGFIADYAQQPENGVEVVAGADCYELQRRDFVERHRKKFNHEVHIYCDYREMIEKENLDGVFITTPDFLHEEMAVFALEHHVPVYLEKPIAISIAGADHILETAYRTRTRLMLGHNMRYMNFTNIMKKVIDSGAIGEVKAVWCRHFINYGGDAYFRDWHATRRNTNSLLLQKGAHDIDIIHWLAGGYTARVNGLGGLTMYDRLPRRPVGQERLPGLTIADVWKQEHYPPVEMKDFAPEINVEDINMIQMRLDNGIFASYEQCHFTPDTTRNYTVIGTRGRLENYGDGAEDSTVEVWTTRKGYRREGDITYRMPPVTDGSHGGSDPLIVQDFIELLRSDRQPRSTVQAARYSVVTGCLGADSIRSDGMPFSIPKLPEHLEHYNFELAR